VRRLDPARRRSAIIVILLTVLLFSITAWVVHGETFSGVDRGARALIREGRPPTLERPMRIVSLLGSGDVLFPLTIACSLIVWRRGHRALALWLPAIGVATSLALAVMKWSIDKPRPTFRGYGFPSGHVFGTTVFVLVGLYLLWAFAASRRHQRLAAAIGIAFVTLVGYSRIYVNAHWLTDVVGGLLAGIAFALVVVLALDTRLR
jgi:membrane-associated phospholipid phosphatase